ncbi:hypothetical protein B0H67DRAFT_103074 [Lasiosphaeris hirsuta]|uniref:Uncharacterized protein n=1 Tax=Lasiosphaeris hirsuta TaxID=260670 RepID=A0AA40AYI9_9PEZI|nr:hypothetical protein B0H67DRAFT_103074 [Lasiosphaeris hirsuta]
MSLAQIWFPSVLLAAKSAILRRSSLPPPATPYPRLPCSPCDLPASSFGYYPLLVSPFIRYTKCARGRVLGVVTTLIRTPPILAIFAHLGPFAPSYPSHPRRLDCRDQIL